MSRENPKTIVLTGTTASGKKSVATNLGVRIGAECLSMDAIKVYRGMNIGAAKGGIENPMHLIDLVKPSEIFSTGRYVESALEKVTHLRSRGVLPLFVGGTGLYLQAIVRGFFDGPNADPELRAELSRTADRDGIGALHRRLSEIDPETAAKVGENDLHRILRALEVFEITGTPISELRRTTTRPAIDGEFVLIGLRWEKEALLRRIEVRVHQMYERGLLEECRVLQSGPLSREASMAIGYREGFQCLRGELTQEQAMERTVIATRQFARRQRNWFRQFPEIKWIDAEEGESIDLLTDRAQARLRE